MYLELFHAVVVVVVVVVVVCVCVFLSVYRRDGIHDMHMEIRVHVCVHTCVGMCVHDIMWRSGGNASVCPQVHSTFYWI